MRVLSGLEHVLFLRKPERTLSVQHEYMLPPTFDLKHSPHAEEVQLGEAVLVGTIEVAAVEDRVHFIRQDRAPVHFRRRDRNRTERLCACKRARERHLPLCEGASLLRSSSKSSISPLAGSTPDDLCSIWLSSGMPRSLMPESWLMLCTALELLCRCCWPTVSISLRSSYFKFFKSILQRAHV